MPCYRCGARATDPARGPSPWRTGVRGGAHVLICPACRDATDWTADLDRCAGCGSTALVRRLGDTTCRACGRTGPAVSAVDEPPAAADSSGVAAEVQRAVERVLGRERD